MAVARFRPILTRNRVPGPPSGIEHVPDEANLLKPLDSLSRKLPLLLLAALRVDPAGEDGVLLKTLRDVAVPRSLLEGEQFPESLIPGRAQLIDRSDVYGASQQLYGECRSQNFHVLAKTEVVEP